MGRHNEYRPKGGDALRLWVKAEYPNVTWRTSSDLFTYLRLFIDMHWTGSSPIRRKVNLIQLMTFELELDFAEYMHHTDVRIADLYCPSYIPSTGYLRLLALSILTCSQNSSTRFGHSRSFGKMSFLHGVWILVHSYLCVRFDLPSSINLSDINGFPN